MQINNTPTRCPIDDHTIIKLMSMGISLQPTRSDWLVDEIQTYDSTLWAQHPRSPHHCYYIIQSTSPLLSLPQSCLGQLASISTYIQLQGLSLIGKNVSGNRKMLPCPHLKNIDPSGHALPLMIKNLMHLMEHMSEHALTPSIFLGCLKHQLQHLSPSPL